MTRLSCVFGYVGFFYMYISVVVRVLLLHAKCLCLGFSTSKGELVRSILFPKPVDFKFSQDGIKFFACLALIALMGMIYTLVLMVSY